jgi:Cu/Ag efflux pump CusA
VIQGTRARLPVICASLLATVLAMLPLVAGGYAAGLEVVRPTALIIIGGMLVSTLVTTLLLPALYLRVAQVAPREVELGPVAEAGQLASA